MSRPPNLQELPPIARARALDRPYQPGKGRRQILIGAVVVAALLASFLALMPHGAPKTPRAAAVPDASPGVVYPKLQVSPAQPPARERQGSTSNIATP